MADVLDRLRADLTTAMKARQTLQVRVIRAALTAIQTEQVATAEARELSRDEEQAVLTREVRKRKESAELYQQGGRPELAEAELAEVQVLEAYLPAALSEAEIDQIVVEAVAAAGQPASDGPDHEDHYRPYPGTRRWVCDRRESESYAQPALTEPACAVVSMT